MKKLLIITAILFLSNLIQAQKYSKVSKITISEFSNSNEMKLLKKEANKLDFSSNGRIVASETKKMEGTDKTGNYSISFIVYSIQNSKKEVFTIAQILNNKTKEKKIWGEDMSKVYIINQKNVNGLRIDWAHFDNCFGTCGTQYLGNNDCWDLHDCIKNCIQKKNNTAPRIWCILWNCSGNAIRCITNLWDFIICFFNCL